MVAARTRLIALLAKRLGVLPEETLGEHGSEVQNKRFCSALSSLSVRKSLWHLLQPSSGNSNSSDEEDVLDEVSIWSSRVDAFVRCVSNLQKSVYIQPDESDEHVVPLEIEAAGLVIRLKIDIVNEVWSTLLPLALWIRAQAATTNTKEHHKRHFIVGLSGPPGFKTLSRAHRSDMSDRFV